MVGQSHAACCLPALALCGVAPPLVVELASDHGQSPRSMWVLATFTLWCML